MSPNHGARLLAGACVTLMLLAGCAAKTPQALLQEKPAGVAPAAALTGVPFFAQSENQCGPASLAMVMNWAHVAVSPGQLTPLLFIPGKQGSLQVEMQALPRKYGLLAYRLNPDLEDLLREISAGHPVIVFQNLAFSWYPRWHYAVVISYDLAAGTITLHSGEEARHTIPLATFQRIWQRGGNWAMLALPPGMLPATADEARYMRAAVDFERAAHPQASVRVYQAALGRWPGNLAARMGLGNSYYALGDLKHARQAFHQATLDHPDAAPAFNNLAQTDLELNRLDEALDAIHTARQLDPDSAVYKQTMQAIVDRLKPERTGKAPVR